MKLLPLLLSLACPLVWADDSLNADARRIAGEFAQTLKPALMQAMSEGGPVHAIGVCAETAPQIAADISHASGWQVKRVSLKARNPAARPDEFEQAVLERFDAAAAQGDSPAALEHGEMIDDEYRYLKAQPVAGLCLTCHGRHIDASVTDKLVQAYPHDAATGYALGEIRGAISLRISRK